MTAASLTEHAVVHLRTALKSQYHAALAMLRLAIARMPDELWASDRFVTPSWRVAYHALYYAHLYSRPRVEDFTPWEHHQIAAHDLDNIPAPREIQEMCGELAFPPQTGAPFTREQILEYWEFCDDMIDDAVDALDLASPESGFPWYKMSKLEHQLVNIRHIQHHTAQLGARIREASRGNNGVDWVGAGREPKWKQFPLKGGADGSSP